MIHLMTLYFPEPSATSGIGVVVEIDSDSRLRRASSSCKSTTCSDSNAFSRCKSLSILAAPAVAKAASDSECSRRSDLSELTEFA